MVRFFHDDDGLKLMAQFCAELTRQGIAFEGGQDGQGFWVRLTGY